MATTLPLGWIDPDSRTSAQQLACDAAVAKMPFFSLAPQGKPEVGTKILLTDLWSHSKVIESYGSKYLGTHQITGSCFPAGTLVTMADGSFKPIEAVRVGDLVLTHTGKFQTVTHTLYRSTSDPMVSLFIANWGWIEMTNDHPVRVQRNGVLDWVSARDIVVGDRVVMRPVNQTRSRVVGHEPINSEKAFVDVCEDGQIALVSKYRSQCEQDPVKVYDLTVDEDHSFVADGLVVHNCVWAGAQNVLCTLQMIETLKNHENEKLIIPFGLANYGRSRVLGGLRGRGEGSFGSTYAQSCTEDGTPDSRLDDLDLPQYTVGDGWIWGRNVELDWSDSRFVPDTVAAEGKKHLIKSTAELKNADAVRDAIINGYPVTRASMVFVNPGTASVRNGALIGTHNGRGGHQESWLGYWNHPQEGELIWEQNQWGMNVYGNDPGGGPGGGCWVRMETVERMCKSQGAEVFAFSQYEGYPAQPDLYDWVNNSFFS